MAAIRFGLIGRYLRPHRRMVLLGMAALVVVNLLSVSIPLLVRGVIDDLQDGFSVADVLRQALLIISLATVMGAVRLWSRMLVFGVGRQVEAELKQRIFDHMLRQEPGWVQTTGSGEVISRATSDVENVRRLLGFAVLSLTNTALAYALTLPAMLAIDPWLSLAAVGLYPLMLVIVRLFGGRMMKQQRRQQEALAQLSDLIQEDLRADLRWWGIGAAPQLGGCWLWRSPGRFVVALRALEAADGEQDAALVARLRDYAERDRHLWRYETGCRRGALGHRREIYRIFARRLADQAAFVAIEDLDLRDFVEHPAVEDGAPTTTPSDRGRVEAGLSELRQAMRSALGDRLIEIVPENTTRTCCSCGARCQWDQAAELEHRCETCGVSWDQDENAAENIRARGEIARAARDVLAAENGDVSKTSKRKERFAAGKQRIKEERSRTRHGQSQLDGLRSRQRLASPEGTGRLTDRASSMAYDRDAPVWRGRAVPPAAGQSQLDDLRSRHSMRRPRPART